VAIQRERLGRALSVADEVRSFRFCGPSEDPDEVTAVTLGFRALAKQFLWSVSRVGDDELSRFYESIPADIEDDIYAAYKLRDDLDPVLGRLDELQDEYQGVASRSLEDILRNRDLEAVHAEFERTLVMVEQDPASAVTAACAIVESICKIVIEDRKLPMPSKQTVKPLWTVVSEDLQLRPDQVEDEDLKRILAALSSLVDGLGALRTHAGSAHGRGHVRYSIQSRYARLAVHAADTLVAFVIETREAQVEGSSARDA
jgi:hypothetical protein